MQPQLAIELKDVNVNYLSVHALRNISWQVPQGVQAAVLGPNGCGKSTLLRTITGYGHVTSGTVRVLGSTLGNVEVHQLRRRLGIVDPTLVRLLDRGTTALQLVATGLRGHLTTLFDRPTQDELDLSFAALSGVGLEQIGDRDVLELSSGQRSRVWLARALIGEPELLILDEPTADLDLRSREILLASLDRLGRRSTQPNDRDRYSSSGGHPARHVERIAAEGRCTALFGAAGSHANSKGKWASCSIVRFRFNDMGNAGCGQYQQTSGLNCWNPNTKGNG